MELIYLFNIMYIHIVITMYCTKINKTTSMKNIDEGTEQTIMNKKHIIIEEKTYIEEI